MTRDELIVAVAERRFSAIVQAGEEWAVVVEMTTRWLDAAEPVIRADEREFFAPEVPMARDDLRNELRAKVEALPDYLRIGHDGVDSLVWRSEVLALFDGGER